MEDAEPERALMQPREDANREETQCDVIYDAGVEEFEGYDIDEFKVAVKDILYHLLAERRHLLRKLLKAKSIIDNPIPKPKPGSWKPKVLTVDGDTLLNETVETILSLDEELKTVDPEILREQLFSICDNPPPVPPSTLQLKLLKKGEDGMTFEYHKIHSELFFYLDIQSLLKFSEASKLCHEAVNVYARKAVYSLPLHSGSVCSNLQYWRQTTEFFFTDAVTVKPISRSNYSPIQAQLRMNKNIFPINEESMKSHTYVSFDCIKPHYIVYCDHLKPMAHTCSASRAIDCDNKAVSKVITLNDFIVEYGKRLEVKDPFSPVWGVPSTMVTPAYVCLLLKMTLETIVRCIKKHEGLFECRRTEYIANAIHHITHRIWLQVSLQWDFRFGQNAQNSLYLNIADHFTWDG